MSGSTTTLLWDIDQASVRLECRQLSGFGLCQTSVSTGSGPVHAWTAHLWALAHKPSRPRAFIISLHHWCQASHQTLYGRNSFLA